MTHFSFKVVQSSLDSVVSDSQQQKPLQTQRRAEARPKKHYLVWVHRWNQGSTKITKKTTFILTLICKLYLVGFFCLSFFLNPLLIHRNTHTHTHTELNIHKILLIQSLFIYLYDKMVKAPCRSMKSDKGVKKKKTHTHVTTTDGKECGLLRSPSRSQRHEWPQTHTRSSTRVRCLRADSVPS